MNLNKTKEALRQYLTSEQYNSVSEIIAGSCSGFQCEVLTEYSRYEMKIILDPQLDYVYIRMYPGIKIPPDCRRAACEYLTAVTDGIKIGALCMDKRFGDIYFKASASVKAAPTDGAVLRQMEELGVSTLLLCESDLLALLHPAPPPHPLKLKEQPDE